MTDLSRCSDCGCSAHEMKMLERKVEEMSRRIPNKKLPSNSLLDQKTSSQLGSWIRNKRVQHDITRSALAKCAGVSSVFVGEIERGRKLPSVGVAVNIARALNYEQDLDTERIALELLFHDKLWEAGVDSFNVHVTVFTS